MQAVASTNIKSKISVLPTFNSILVGCFIFSGHIIHNIPNAYSVEVEVSSGLDMTCVSKFGSVFPFCLVDAADDLDGMANLGPAALFACLALCFVVVVLKSQLGGISEKGKISVLPNSHSLALICAICCAHVAQHSRTTFGGQRAGIFSKSMVASACVSKFGSVFPFCLPDMNHMDVSDGMSEVLAAVVTAQLAVLPAQLGVLALGLVVMTAQHLRQSASSVDKSKQNSVLPNFHSSMIICAVFCAHAARDLRNAYGVQGTAGESGVDSECVAKFGSEFPFCLPDGHSATTSKVFPAVVLGFVTVSLIAMAAQNLAQSYLYLSLQRRIYSSWQHSDEKNHVSVLPNLYSLLLGCSIFFAHLYHNAQNVSGILDTASVSIIGSIVSVMVVRTVMQQSTNINTKGKISVLPNAYSFFMICCVFCAHCVHHFTGLHGVQVAIGDYVTSASILEGIVKVVPGIQVLFFVVVMALRLQSSHANKKRQASVLPSIPSVMLICCVLCAHTVHNQPEKSNMSSPSSIASPILGASSGMVPFGHKDHGVEDIALNISDSIPANILDKSLEHGVKASGTSTYTYPAQHSEVISEASPKAIFASVLFAFIGMTLKLGSKSSDKKGNKSLLPNFRSVLLICCILFGHAVHNWSYTDSEHNSQVSVYTGVDEVAAWDDYGAVLPDSPDDLDYLLEVSPDALNQPSDLLTSR